MTTFKEWLDTATPVREHPWSKNDVRAGFEAGRRSGLEEAAMAMEHLAGNANVYALEMDPDDRKIVVTILELASSYVRALASAPPVADTSEGGSDAR